MPRPAPGLGTQEQQKSAGAELREAQVKLLQQESALRELSERGEGGTRTIQPHLYLHPDPSATHPCPVILTSNPDPVSHPDPDPGLCP